LGWVVGWGEIRMQPSVQDLCYARP
jgi:hypothetical protein